LVLCTLKSFSFYLSVTLFQSILLCYMAGNNSLEGRGGVSMCTQEQSSRACQPPLSWIHGCPHRDGKPLADQNRRS
jgi:hypothetical protein